MKRCGVPRGWVLGLVGVAVVLAVEPIRTTLGYGQVNTLLMALVVADLLPDRAGERRRIPQGTLIGLAAAIKLTPALFVVFAFLVGRRRVAWTAMISFVALHRPSARSSSGHETVAVLVRSRPAATPGPPRRSTWATSRCSGSSTG